MKYVTAGIVVACGVAALGSFASSSRVAAAGQGPSLQVDANVSSDVSGPLKNIPPKKHEPKLHEHPLLKPEGPQAPGGTSGMQSTPGPLLGGTVVNFAGVGKGDYGFSPDAAPPDTNGAVGAFQYVQWVNESFAVFDKSTHLVTYGPAAGNTLWSGFGGGCETNNDGDPIVQYDKQNNVWIFTQFSVSTTPFLQCVAVSTTSDATGPYNRYAFSYGNQFPDYPKLGVWPDAYYVTYNMFNNGVSFAGPRVCAWDGAAMRAASPSVRQVCFQLSNGVHSLLPSDLDGKQLPAVGTPNLLARITTSSALQFWQFSVNWANPSSSTLTGPTTLAVAAYTQTCSGGDCIPQPGTSQQLDSLADRAMYRFAYRTYGGYDWWVLNHSVATSIVRNRAVGSAIRWYELRRSAGSASTPTVNQQGTYAPDATYRWMGSIAKDKLGDILVGYSVSSSTVPPGIRMAGRPGDGSLASGLLGAENVVQNGGGSQTSGLNRWGDYSAMSVDPVDDCTFYYTNQYQKANGTFNWSTRIATFKFPSCS
jgi:hypothetical protein